MKDIRYIFFGLLLLLFGGPSGCATITGEPGPGDEIVIDPGAAPMPYEQYVEGQPNINFRDMGGIYIWRNGNRWSVRLAKKPDIPKDVRKMTPYEPLITGNIHLQNATSVNLAKQNVGPFNSVRMSSKGIAFSFDLKEAVEGFDFDALPTYPNYCITFDVRVDGVPRPGIVHLGQFMRLPEKLPLKMCLSPHQYR